MSKLWLPGLLPGGRNIFISIIMLHWPDVINSIAKFFSAVFVIFIFMSSRMIYINSSCLAFRPSADCTMKDCFAIKREKRVYAIYASIRQHNFYSQPVEHGKSSLDIYSVNIQCLMTNKLDGSDHLLRER